MRVRGNTIIPSSLFSTHRFVILCAILRQLHLLVHITLLTSELRTYNPTVIFIDQLSAGLILLRLLCPAIPTLFYCHFPDKLLARGRQNWVKSIYRVPFDALERWSTGLADKIVVNSYFTKRVFLDAFPGLAVGKGEEKKKRTEKGTVGVKELSVVYPCVRLDEFDGSHEETTILTDGEGLLDGKKIMLSINRFEEKKDISLAIRAFAILDRSLRNNVRLVIAGIAKIFLLVIFYILYLVLIKIVRRLRSPYFRKRHLSQPITRPLLRPWSLNLYCFHLCNCHEHRDQEPEPKQLPSS